jgi:hypothetical protein
MTPIVTGEVNVDALDELVRLCVELERHRRGADGGTPAGAGDADDGSDGDGSDGDGAGRAAGPDTSRAWDALERAVIGKTMVLLLHS